jgi:predicted enzyme related to lactoylglutathione lyase
MAAPIVHIEFSSVDFPRSAAFYAQLFGWQTQQNGTATYMKFDGDDGPSGGWVRSDMVQSPGPIPYVAVDDLGKALDKAERAGGRVVVRSMAFAGGGEVALVADPDGHVVGLWKRKRAEGKGEGGAKADGAKPAPAKAERLAKPAPKAAIGDARKPAKPARRK